MKTRIYLFLKFQMWFFTLPYKYYPYILTWRWKDGWINELFMFQEIYEKKSNNFLLVDFDFELFLFYSLHKHIDFFLKELLLFVWITDTQFRTNRLLLRNTLYYLLYSIHIKWPLILYFGMQKVFIYANGTSLWYHTV